MARTLDHILHVRTDEEFLDLIDDWRRRQKDLPSRAESVRRLVRRALKAETA